LLQGILDSSDDSDSTDENLVLFRYYYFAY